MGTGKSITDTFVNPKAKSPSNKITFEKSFMASPAHKVNYIHVMVTVPQDLSSRAAIRPMFFATITPNRMDHFSTVVPVYYGYSETRGFCLHPL